MDMGTIENLKTHYRRHMLRETLARMANRVQFRPNLLQALRFLKQAWDDVKAETVRNCFKEAGFVIMDDVSYAFIYFVGLGFLDLLSLGDFFLH